MVNNIFLRIINKPILKDTINITILRTFARALGAMIPFFIAAWFGVSSQTDAFFFVYGIVIFFTSIFSSVLESFIVPFIAEFKAKNTEDVKIFISDILVSSGLLITIASLACLIVLKPLLSVATKFSPQTLELVFWMFLEIMPLLLFSTLSGVLSGALNAHKDFRIPAISPGFRAVIALTVIFFTKRYIGIHSIPLGYVIGEIVRFFLLFKVTFQDKIIIIKISLKFIKNVFDFFKVTLYRTIGMLAIAFTPIIDRIMATWLGSGSITIIDYAEKIYSIPVAFIVEGFLVVALSHWSETHYNESSTAQLKKKAIRTCKVMAIVALLVAGVLFIGRNFITDVIYGGRKIDPEQLSLIGTILGYYLLGFVPLMLVMTLGNVYIILKKARFLMIVGFIMIASRIVLNLILIKAIGLPGIALSASLAPFIILIIYLWSFRRLK